MAGLASKLSSEDLYRQIVSTAQEGVWIFDTAGRTLFANQKLAEMLATSVDDLMTARLWDFLDPTWREAPQDQGLLPRTVEPERREYMLRRRDGRELWTLITSSSFFDDDKVSGVLALLSDVSQQKRALRLQQALTRIQQVIAATLDVDEIMRRVMDEAAAALGCDSASVILREDEQWVIRYVAGFPSQLVGRTFADQEMPHGMKAIETRDVVAVEDLVSAGGLSDEQLSPYGARAVLVLPLLTQNESLGVIFLNYRKAKDPFDPMELSFARQLAAPLSLALANARLFAAERQGRLLFEKLVQASPAGIVLLDPELHVKVANPAYALSGTHLAGHMTGVQSLELLQRMQRVAQSGESESEAEWPYDSPSRGRTYWHWTLTPLSTGSRDAPDVLFQVIDVTEQVTARKQIEQLAEELQQQAEELEIQTEELQAQNDELLSVTGQLADERARLEERVRQRTAELAAANTALRDEVAERKRAEEQIREQAARTAMLAELSEALAEAGPDYEAVLNVVVWRIARVIGDSCVVAVVAEDSDIVQPVAFAHRRPAAATLLKEIYTRNAQRVGEGVAGRVLQSGEPVFVPQLDEAQARKSLLPEYLPYYDTFGIDSILVVPLRAHDSIIGTLGLSRDRGGQPYTRAELSFVQSLADRAALAIANARLYRELQVANHRLEVEVAHNQAAKARLAKQAAELAQTAARLQEQAELLDLTNDAVIARDMQAKIRFWNSGAEKQYGWTRAEVLGKRSHDLFQTIFPAPIEDVYAELLARGRWDGELSHSRRDGKRIIVAARWALQRDARGVPIGVLEINNDITAQKEAQAQLAYQARMLENVTDAVIALDAEMKITLWNRGAEEMFGLRAEQVLGLTMQEAIPYEHIEPDQQGAHQILMAEGRFRGEFRFQRPDGRAVLTETTGLLLRDHDGRAIGYLGVSRDITARRRAEESLRDSLHALEHQAQRLALLRNIDRAVLSAQSVGKIAQIATDEVRQLVDCPSAALMLFDLERQQAEVLAISTDRPGPYIAGERMDLTEYGLPAEQHRGMSQYVRDLCKVPNPSQHEQTLAAVGVRSFLGVPLMVEGRLTGSLDLGSYEIDAFSESDEELVRQVADSLAVALQNAQLYEREQRARKAAEALRGANIALTASLDLNVALGNLLDVLEQWVPYDIAQVLLLEDPDRLAISAERHSGHNGHHAAAPGLVGKTIELEDCAPLRVTLANGRATLVSDTASFDGWQQMRGFRGTRCWMGIPLLVGGKPVGIIALGRTLPASFTAEHVTLAEGIAAQAALAIQNAQFFSQVESGRRELQALSRRLIDVQEAERRAIARELHDEAGQALTSLLLGFGSLEKEAGQPDAVVARARQMKALTDSTLEGLHRLAANLRPASLDRLGLVPALEQYVENYRRQHNIQIEMVSYGFDERTAGRGAGGGMTPDLQTALYRVVQEALTNIARHAHASRIGIILERHSDRVNIVIEDDGVGFDVEAARLRGRLGLFGMQERAEALGGKFAVESFAGAGTTVFIELPLSQQESDEVSSNDKATI